MDLFDIGFLSIKLIDIIDILIVAYVFYKLYTIMRGTIASQIFFALLLIIGLSFLAQFFNMKALGWLLSRLTEIWVIAFIILFQPEIRRLLLIIGKTRPRFFGKYDINEDISEVVDACIDLQKRGWGALIVFVRSAGLQNIIETGEMVQAKINKDLLLSIFNTKSPLHDGAVVIKDNKIEAARCLLPLSETSNVENKNLGTRHRAGLGVTEISDAVAVIVSEETSQISIAEDGKLYTAKDVKDLKNKLKEIMSEANVSKSFKTVFENTNEDRPAEDTRKVKKKSEVTDDQRS